MQLAAFPRIRLAHLPTPLERLDRLSDALGGPTIWVKRDDCTGLAGGGNKTRKLEFLIADALAQDATVVLTPGAIQSNHARQTAAAAARVGLSSHLVLENRTGHEDDDYLRNGNVLLDHLLGAGVEIVPAGGDPAAALDAARERVLAAGGRPYVIPGGGSNEIGALGYVLAATELVAQATDAGFEIAEIVHATGSTGTQAGLVTGLAATRAGISTLGVSVMHDQATQERRVLALAESTAEVLGVAGCVGAADVRVDDGHVGPGYGLPTPGMVEALELVARTEGVVLDPVYTGKAMAGLVHHARAGRWARGEHVVFVHTGGAQGLPGYRSTFVP